MICKFCGLNNADDAAFCSRCGSPLKENRKQAAPDFSDEQTVDDDKKTMRMETHPEESKNDGVLRHDCGYPLLPGMTVCPKCRRPVGGGSLDAEKQKENENRNDGKEISSEKKKTERFVGQDQKKSNAKKTERFVGLDQNDSNAKKTERFVGQDLNQNESASKKTERFVKHTEPDEVINKKTVDIHQIKAPKVKETAPVLPPHCSLKPVAREDEDATKFVKQEFETEKVVLNRQNTEPDNYTITSHQQALLTYENGKWYIEDRSTYKSTYIRVTRKIELQDGDVVAMGDREFDFSTK